MSQDWVYSPDPGGRRRIRPENAGDYEAVYHLVQRAFATAPFSDGTEAEYLDRLRKGPHFIPGLSLVAVENERLVGQVVLYRTNVESPGRTVTQLVLSPLSVDPDHFRRGIGKALVNEGCRRARLLGYKAVFLCGEKEYYSRFGFVPTYKYGIYHKKDSAHHGEWCMVKELEPGFLQGLSGLIEIE